jgi:hypothetical protein
MIMKFLETRDCRKIWIFFALLLACLFMTIGAYAQSESKIKTKEVTKIDQGLKMVAEALGGAGGKSESANFKMKISSVGQPSPFSKLPSTVSNISKRHIYATLVLHGEANADGIVNIADVVYLINYVWIDGPDPIPLEAGDLNCDGVIDIEDVTYLIRYLLAGGTPPCNL